MLFGIIDHALKIYNYSWFITNYPTIMSLRQ